MDRYDRIIRDIQQKTAEEIVHWKVVPPDRNSDILVNLNRIIRCFEANYPVGEESYILLFVERRIESHEEYYYDMTEERGFELIILGNDHQIVISLVEGAVDRDDLLKLSGLIDAHNDRARDFFAAFDKSGAT